MNWKKLFNWCIILGSIYGIGLCAYIIVPDDIKALIYGGLLFCVSFKIANWFESE